VTFRNLGWSGDTVFGEARASFDPPAVGYRRLVEHTLSVKPTVIFLGYGTNESFEGSAGLPKFVKGLETLLDALAPSRARIVLLSPLRHEDLGPPLPDPAEQNRNIRLYAGAIRDVAQKRGHLFVDLYERLGDGTKVNPPAAHTDNGMHLTAYGYWRAAAALEQGLGLNPAPWRIDVVAPQSTVRVALAAGAQVRPVPVSFEVADTVLPKPAVPKEAPRDPTWPGTERVLRVAGLPEGQYLLRIDGQQVVSASAGGWAVGVTLRHGPQFDQVERLRAAIIEKNHQYFHRWRPQNETYLFGFRKHEQGQNAREIPQFDPHVAELENQIARLRIPVKHTYELLTGHPAQK
jgi:lysophospholipase L1-like esterase